MILIQKSSLSACLSISHSHTHIHTKREKERESKRERKIDRQTETHRELRVKYTIKVLETLKMNFVFYFFVQNMDYKISRLNF